MGTNVIQQNAGAPIAAPAAAAGEVDLPETAIAESSRASGWMESEQESEKRKVAQVHAEVERVKQLPPCSAYASHRLRVLNKMLDVLSVHPKARTASQAEELELLFAGMSL